MGIYKAKDRRGRQRYVVSKYWPNGSGRLRMYAPNYRSAKALHIRVEASILDGTWEQLKQELSGGKREIWTVRRFYERFSRGVLQASSARLGNATNSRSRASTPCWGTFP